MSEKKKFYQKWWFWAIVAVVVLGVIGSTTQEKNKQESNNPDTNKSSVTQTTTQAATTADQHTAIGSTIKSKTVNLTVESVGVITSDNQFTQPEDEKEFVEVVLLIESTATKDDVFISYLNADAYVDGFATDLDIWACGESDFDALSGTLAPGKKLRGCLCYSLPIGWKELELQIEVDWISGEKITLLLKNEGK
jgi:hypothetical protein